MKKLLACGLILTMLSSTGAMCFANEEVEVVNTIQVSATEVAATEESQDNEVSQEELLIDIESIKSDKNLTAKEKFEKAWSSVKEFVEDSVRPEGKLAKAWGYVKNFVKEHYIAVSAVAASVVFVVLACLCGPTVVDALKGLFDSGNAGEGKTSDEAEAAADVAIVVEESPEATYTVSVINIEKSQRAQLVDAPEDKENENVIINERKEDENVIIEKDADKKDQQKGFLGRFLDCMLPTYPDSDF